MKAIFVQSRNGYLAKGPEDDLSWAPILDKKLFKMFSLAFGGVCVCSDVTYAQLPDKMKADKYRQFIVATLTGENSLKNLNKIYPNAVLVGGPTFLKAAYNEGVIDTIITTTVEVVIESTLEYKNPFLEIPTHYLGGVNIESLYLDFYKLVEVDNE